VKGEALDRTVWGNLLFIGCGPVVRNECYLDTSVSACGLDDPRSPRGSGWNFPSFHVRTDCAAEWGRLYEELRDRAATLTTVGCRE